MPMLLSEVEDISNKARQFIADANKNLVDRNLIELSLNNLSQILSSEQNERFEFLQHPDMQEQLDAGLPADPDVHPFVIAAAEELQVLMNQYLN